MDAIRRWINGAYRGGQLSAPAILAVLFLLCPTRAWAAAGWNLYFSDEFNDSTVDTSVWTPIYTGPNSGDLEAYVTDDVYESGGQLHLKAEKRNYTRDGRTYNYTSGIILGDKGASSLTYGYFEIRTKVPSGNGYWPAFWMLPISGSLMPEIDVVELLMKTPTVAYLTYHWSSSNQTDSSSWNGPDFSNDYHTFAVDWEPGSIIWYIDGIVRKTVTGSNVSNVPMYPIANLTVGDYDSWAGGPDANTPFPSTMDIDYIRIYQKVSGNACYSAIPKPTDPIPVKNCSVATPTCDLSGDGSVNAVDLQRLANNVLAASTTGDVNKDGKVDAIDIQVLVNVIMGKSSCP